MAKDNIFITVLLVAKENVKVGGGWRPGNEAKLANSGNPTCVESTLDIFFFHEKQFVL